MMTRRRMLTTILGGLAFAGLSACGRKNQPKHPPGSEYPQHYPYFPPDKRYAKTPPPPEEQSRERGDSQLLKLDPIQDRSR